MFDKFASKNFQSTKIQQNTHFPHLLSGSDSEYLGTVAPHILNKGTILQPNQSEKQSFHFEGKVQEICDLEDLWNTFEQKEQVVKVKKTEIANIFDDPETLTTQEMEQIFGEQYSNVQSLSQASEHVKGNEEAQDLGDLWDMVNTEDPKQSSQNNPHQSQESQQSQTQQKNRLRSLQIQRRQLSGKSQIAQVKSKELQLKKESRQAKKQHQQPKMEKLQFYQVEQKQVQTEGRVCLTLGKDFAIYDYANFLTSCLSTSVYCYFGFKRTENEQYCFYDLTTNQPLMVGKLSKYEQYIQNNGEQRKIEYQKSYCLKIKIAHSDETIATIWLKQISNGLLYNIRHYNDYERTHDESAALVEITDSYIGKNCYCNTNVFISQKFCTHPGQLKMKLSLKNGYLIANMGVSGIKSAPYNCRLENPNNSFVYLLGLLDKEEEKFIVRVGEGISPVIAFATSIGRKRYIDSFKD